MVGWVLIDKSPQPYAWVVRCPRLPADRRVVLGTLGR